MVSEQDLINALDGGATQLDKTLTSQNSFSNEGFTVPPISSADGKGLPFSKVKSQKTAKTTRNTMHWYVPEVGIVKMYVNPQGIDYSFKKLISPDRTKGGYVLQYWGEELPTLNIRGNTGSSGIEGLNVLYEIYRSEQLSFDAIGLTLAANSNTSGLGELVGQVLDGINGIGNTVSNATNGILGNDPASQNILPRNIPTLASLAYGVELFYDGWVFRGFFNSFTFSEKADNFLIDYNINFTVTQRRGYRTNYFPFHRSANFGPSNNSEGGVPLTFNGISSR
jgi:hypothetical protein